MLKISNVSKSFINGSASFKALKDVNLEIKRSEIFGIIGYSGAGKSTLLRIMAGIEKADLGEVLIDGINLVDLKGQEKRHFRHNIGVVFQGYNLLMQRNVFKNIAFPLELQKIDKKLIEKRVDELLDLTGISDKKYSRISNLSGGQKQRVAIARALASRPKVLLLDEFTSALDIQTTNQILNLILEIRDKEDITICLITHDINVVRKIADRIAVIHDGEVVEVGQTEDVLLNPKDKITKILLGDVR